MDISTGLDACALAMPDTDQQGWPVIGRLLDALTRRDFAGIRACLDERVRFRALVPRGLIEHDNDADVADQFEQWFGGDESFEVVDASIGQMGTKLYVRWRVRLHTPGAPQSGRIAEQHVFTSGEDRIVTLDLLCSGFHAETGATS